MSGVNGLPLPGTRINGDSSLGTTAQRLYTRREGQVLDYFIQNLSANNVYIVAYEDQPVAQAIKIVPGGNASKDNWTGDLIIVADGAGSDVRQMLQIHPPPWTFQSPLVSGR